MNILRAHPFAIRFQDVPNISRLISGQAMRALAIKEKELVKRKEGSIYVWRFPSKTAMEMRLDVTDTDEERMMREIESATRGQCAFRLMKDARRPPSPLALELSESTDSPKRFKTTRRERKRRRRRIGHGRRAKYGEQDSWLHNEN